MYRWWIALRSRRNRLWLSSAASVLLAVALALVAKVANRLVGDEHVPSVPAETLDSLLTVIASSMLAVATFTLGVMVSAFATAAATATPRATELVMGDPGTRRAVSSFIAAFIFAIVAKVALAMGYYGETGRFVLALATLGVLAYLVVVLVLWVKTLATLGRLSDTLERIRHVVWETLADHAREPFLGGIAAPTEAPAGTPVHPQRVGLVTHLDIAALQSAAEDADVRVHLFVRPGDTVDPSRPLLVVHGAGHAEVDPGPLRDAVVLDWMRSFDQDPRFGLVVLAEVAQRALSPAINDPGTAIVVLNTMAALLVRAAAASGPGEVRHDRVAVPPIAPADLVRDAFAPVARDGAAMCEVIERLIKVLTMLAANSRGALSEAAAAQAGEALNRSLRVLQMSAERRRLAEVYRRGFGR